MGQAGDRSARWPGLSRADVASGEWKALSNLACAICHLPLHCHLHIYKDLFKGGPGQAAIFVPVPLRRHQHERGHDQKGEGHVE